MNITDVQIKIVNNEAGRLKAIASFVIDNCFAVHDIKIIDGNDGLFIAMPSKKIPNGEFKDIAHPINSETREILKEQLFKKYHEEIEKLNQ